MKKLIFLFPSVAAIMLVAPHARAGQTDSRYAPLMHSAHGLDTLQSLALWEDQRVTGDGKLFVALRRGSPLVRLRAAEVIGRIQDPADVPVLIRALRDPSPPVAAKACFGLGQIADTTATGALITLARGSNKRMVLLSAEALGKIGGPRAAGELVKLLHHFDGAIRSSAALALARAHDESAVPGLLIAIHDPDLNVVWRAIYALEKTPTKHTADKIREFLNSPSPLVRAYTARTLGKLKDGRSVDGLIGALQDRDRRVVINAARALGKIGARRACGALGKLLASSPSHNVRTAAANALGNIGKKSGEDALIQALLDPSAGVRAASIEALAKIVGNEIPLFAGESMNDGSRLVRAAAIRAFGQAKSNKSAGQLMKIAQNNNDPMMRSAAVESLGELKNKRIVPFLIERLRSESDWVVATGIIEALSEQDDPAATGALADAYRHRANRTGVNARVDILKTLTKWKALEGKDIALDAIERSDPRLRTRGRELLEAIGAKVPPMKTNREVYEATFDRSRAQYVAPPSGTGHAIITTPHGDIEIELFGDDAIQTVHNFVSLVKRGLYNGLTFHRVVPNFVVQGGDPRGDGWGDAGYFIRSEFNEHRFRVGEVGMATDGKDTGGCQFFIMQSAAPHLNGRYTAFGRVIRGMDVVDKVDIGDVMTVRIVD